MTGEPGYSGSGGNSVGTLSDVLTLTQTGVAGAIGDRTTTYGTSDIFGGNVAIVPDFTIDSSGGYQTPAPGQGILAVSTNALSTSFDVQVSYAVTDLDLSAGDRFTFNMNGDLDDRAVPASLPFNIQLTSGATTNTAGVTMSADGAYEILFSAFSGINFADIDGIVLHTFDGVSSPDYAISAIEVQIVPIPAAFWLFGSALGLVGWMRRKAA